MKSVTRKTARARKTLYALGAIVCLLLLSLSLFAQANFGRILGIVTDQTGAVIPGATVNIIDKDRGPARTLTTDAAGAYDAPALIPGTYTVRVEAKGFKTLERANILLEVGKEVRADLSPEIGEQTQTVEIVAAAPLIETTNATLGGTLSNTEINDMPLNGRNYINLLSLRPGVMLQPGQGPWTESTNNIRPDETAWMLNGVISFNFYDAQSITNRTSPWTDGAIILPIDSIQEFNVQENPKAEYGWKPGATVNVGVKSGTNTLHGSAYAFGRSDAWDARNFFNPAPVNGVCLLNPDVVSVCNKTPAALKQFGGVVGGPIRKDKLFFFTGYEGLRSSIGNSFSTTVPETGPQSTADPSKSLVDAITALQARGVTLSPVSLKLAGCTAGATPSCNGGFFQGAAANTTGYISAFPNVNTSDNGIAKIDYRINSNHAIFGSLFVGNYSGDGEDHPLTARQFLLSYPERAWSNVENWTWTVSSRVVNEARFGYNRASFGFINDDAGIPADGTGLTGGKGYPINTGITSIGGLPNINITGFASLGTWKGRPTFQSPNPNWDIQDSVSYLVGRHTLKFGGEFAHAEADWRGSDRGRIDFQGKKTFTGSTPLEDFLAGTPSRGYLLVGNPIRRATWKSTAGFFQDDWRVTPRVMLNLGLRYSYVSPIKEVNNLLGTFDPAVGLVQQGQKGYDTLWKPDYKDFSPRVGFAWDVTGKGTTVVRGGASVIYSGIYLAAFLSQPVLANVTSSTNLAAVPTGACKTAVPIGTPCPATYGGTMTLSSSLIPASSLNWNGTVFPTGAGVACTAGAPCNTMAVDPNLTTPYITNWNFTVQHAFTNNLSLELGYVGNHGERLFGFRDINQFDPNNPAEIACGHCEDPANRPFGVSFPYLQYINMMSNQARSNYNSLQTTLTKRLSRGLSFIAGYTYGHGLDNGSLTRFTPLPQNSKNPGLEYASSDFDVRHRFTFTTTYNLPSKKGFGQLLEGWKINSILSMQTAQPWNIGDSQNDFSGSADTADRWDFFGNPSDFKSGSSSIPYCIQGKGGVSCTSQSGVDGSVTVLPASLYDQCKAVAPDPSTLAAGGCYVKGKSVMVPPKAGTFGTMGRNIFRDRGFKNLDFSVFKTFTFKERYRVEYRVEFFNLLNHPTIANPYGASNGYGGGNDAGNPSLFGCGCATADVAAGSPIVSSGSNRVMQMGLKIVF